MPLMQLLPKRSFETLRMSVAKLFGIVPEMLLLGSASNKPSIRAGPKSTLFESDPEIALPVKSIWERWGSEATRAHGTVPEMPLWVIVIVLSFGRSRKL